VTIVSSGSISINSLVGEYGGSTPHSLSEYYRGGSLVANHSNNANVPTSGTIQLDDFYGASNTSPTDRTLTFYAGWYYQPVGKSEVGHAGVYRYGNNGTGTQAVGRFTNNTTAQQMDDTSGNAFNMQQASVQGDLHNKDALYTVSNSYVHNVGGGVVISDYWSTASGNYANLSTAPATKDITFLVGDTMTFTYSSYSFSAALTTAIGNFTVHSSSNRATGLWAAMTGLATLTYGTQSNTSSGGNLWTVTFS